MSNQGFPPLIADLEHDAIEHQKIMKNRLNMLMIIFGSGQLDECPFCHAVLELSGMNDERLIINHPEDCEFKIEVLSH